MLVRNAAADLICRYRLLVLVLVSGTCISDRIYETNFESPQYSINIHQTNRLRWEPMIGGLSTAQIAHPILQIVGRCITSITLAIFLVFPGLFLEDMAKFAMQWQPLVLVSMALAIAYPDLVRERNMLATMVLVGPV